MSITFDDQPLFASGPATCHADGIRLIHDTDHPLSAGTSQFFAAGQSGRTITQNGTLQADSPEDLRTQQLAIEAKLDGLPHMLIDEHNQSWPSTVMLSFKPGSLTPAGQRWQLPYVIEYLQLITR